MHYNTALAHTKKFLVSIRPGSIISDYPAKADLRALGFNEMARRAMAVSLPKYLRDEAGVTLGQAISEIDTERCSQVRHIAQTIQARV